MSDTSRDPNDLYPPLRDAWNYLRDEWKRRFPEFPQPYLIATFRGPEDQDLARKAGKSKVGFGDSLHNFRPAYAFDVAFDPDTADGIGNDVTWTLAWYEKFGEMAEALGLEWGGRWASLVDGPHIQMPMTADDARYKNIPNLPAIPPGAPSPGDGRRLVLLFEGDVVQTLDLPPDADVIVRYAPDRERVYVDVRREDS